MPQFLENALLHAAAKRGLKAKDADRYVYGAMNNIGAMHGSKETAKGAEMEEKHEADKAKVSSSHPLRRLSRKFQGGHS